MNIIVCIKQVPGTSDVQVDPVTGVLKRDGTESKLNPYDLYALELALQLAGTQHTVKTITMGPPQAKAAVMETLYMGANSGAVISDRKFAGADVLATSYTLAQGLQKQGDYGLIICGKQTTDGDTAQVGAEIAESLGLPHISNVESILRLDDDSVTVRAHQDASIVTATLKLPCLICTDGGINVPRLPSYKRKMKLSDKLISFYTLADMQDTNEMHYGLNGSPTQVVRIFPPEKSTEKEIWEGSGALLAEKLQTLLEHRKFI
ncbi:MAG: electron transfer flavoprotein subunit beta/FixA family protein [Ruthenibacterium sp.]